MTDEDRIASDISLYEGQAELCFFSPLLPAFLSFPMLLFLYVSCVLVSLLIHISLQRERLGKREREIGLQMCLSLISALASSSVFCLPISLSLSLSSLTRFFLVPGSSLSYLLLVYLFFASSMTPVSPCLSVSLRLIFPLITEM